MKNQSITPEVRPFLTALDKFMTLPSTHEKVKEIAKALLQQLSKDNPATVIDFPKDDLPEGIRTIRIAAFYPDIETGIERHSNSTQFLYSIQGMGETQVLRSEKWEVDFYGAPNNTNNLENRWHVVEKNIWHQSVARGDSPWILAALHTAEKVEDEYQE